LDFKIVFAENKLAYTILNPIRRERYRSPSKIC